MNPVSNQEAAALPASCDLLVVGSGAGGLSAAVSAAHLGLDVVLLEQEAHFGGTTAWSGGWMFVPRNPLARAAGIDEPLDEVQRYLSGAIGPAACSPRMAAFLAQGPAMLRFFAEHTALRFIDGNAIPDFHGRVPGARAGGRSVCAAPFDAARLGPHMGRLKPPAPWYSFLGMSIGGDLRHFLRAARAWDSLAYVAGRLLRHGLDVLRHGQGRMRWGGNALVAALLRSALDAGVRLYERHAAVALMAEPAAGSDGSSSSDSDSDGRGAGGGASGAGNGADGGGARRVVGVRVRTPSGLLREVRARRGVVLACGGFPHDAARKAALFPHAPTGLEHWSAAPVGNTGAGLRLAEAAGGLVDTTLADAGAWAPVSLLPQRGAAPASFAHLAERGKPGLIAVDRDGQRFVNEAGNYHSFMRALFARATERHPGHPVQAWLICDHRFQRRYGLGHSRPRPLPTRWHRRVGYLHCEATLEALARRCGIDAPGLAHTVATFNAAARAGHDPAFGRGETAYERMQGDAEHPGPNPCVAAIEHGPFYAVRVVPGSLGTFAGLRTDENARVLDAAGSAIEGLYAAGNDMASVMHGHYPSGGITLGPAMTFGYLLAHHVAGHALAPAATSPTAQAPGVPAAPIMPAAPMKTNDTTMNIGRPR